MQLLEDAARLAQGEPPESRARPFGPLPHLREHVAKLADIRLDECVIAAARAGDESAQCAIYAALAPATFGLIRRLVGAKSTAEDLFQETMITVYQQLGAFRGEAPLGAWVRRIAVSKSLMHLRSPWHRARLGFSGTSEDDPLNVSLATPGPTVDGLDVERALASLAPTARAVVWLYEVEGYSHEEIARVFGRTVSFSKSQLARAHRRLRAWLEPRTERQPCTPI